MSRQLKAGVPYYEAIPVFETDGTTLHSGLAGSNFTLTLIHNGALTTLSSSFAEVGSTGLYALQIPGGFTNGTWNVFVRSTFDNAVWEDLVEVYTNDIDSAVPFDSGLYSVTLITRDTSNANARVPNSIIYVYNSLGTTLITFGTASTLGVLIRNLNAGTYIVRTYAPGFSFDDATITVSATESFNIDGASFSIPSPTDPTVCAVYGDFVSLDGTPLVGLVVRVTNLFDPNASNGLAVMQKQQDYVTDADGRVSMNLVRGIRVAVAFAAASLRREFTVPDADTANLATLLGSATDNFVIVRP